MMYSTSILREASAMLQRSVSESVDKHFSGRRERDVLRCAPLQPFAIQQLQAPPFPR